MSRIPYKVDRESGTHAGLPPNYVVVRARSGREYYFNRVTKRSTYEHPGGWGGAAGGRVRVCLRVCLHACVCMCCCVGAVCLLCPYLHLRQCLAVARVRMGSVVVARVELLLAMLVRARRTSRRSSVHLACRTHAFAFAPTREWNPWGRTRARAETKVPTPLEGPGPAPAAAPAGLLASMMAESVRVPGMTGESRALMLCVCVCVCVHARVLVLVRAQVRCVCGAHLGRRRPPTCVVAQRRIGSGASSTRTGTPYSRASPRAPLAPNACRCQWTILTSSMSCAFTR
jgi:hypothetical protein